MNNKLALRMIEDITEDYYSHFCGLKLSELRSGIFFVPSEERDSTLAGQGCKYTMYILAKDNVCAVSYSPKYSNIFENMKKRSANEIIMETNRQFKLKKMKLMTFEKETVFDYGSAQILCAKDYPLFEAFFRAMHPNADPSGWLKEYFAEKTDKEYFSGYFSDNKLVSVCDAPDMPYMQGIVQHTGISTLVGERKKGYARRTLALAVHHLIQNGICPQYECDADNTASFSLALSVGFKEYGTAYILKE